MSHSKNLLPWLGVSLFTLAVFAFPFAALGQLKSTVIVKAGDVANGTGGAAYSFLNAPVISDDGSILLTGGLTGTGVTSTNNHGIWGARSGDGLGLIARRGDLAPGSNERSFRNFFSNPRIANEGRFIFGNQVLREGFTSASDTGIWSGSLGGVTAAVAIQNSPEPGSTASEHFFRVSTQNSSVNSSGRFLFSGSVGMRGDRGYESNSIRDVLWTRDPITSTVTRIATASNRSDSGGDLAPSDELASSMWKSFEGNDINDGGQITFLARTTASTLEGYTGSSIWSGNPNNLKLIAKEGDQAAGLSGNTWTKLKGSSTADHPVINGSGNIAFNGQVVDSEGNNRYGVWSGNQGSLRLVAISGQMAPGTGATGTTLSGMEQVDLNNSDQTMFAAYLEGSAVTGSNNRAIYATDAFGQLALAVRTGSNIEVDGQNLRLSSFNVAKGGGLAGDATLGTSRLAYYGVFFQPGAGTIRAAMVADMNDVYIDSIRSSNSLTLEDSSRRYTTAGDLKVGTAGTGEVNFLIREDSNAPENQIVVTAKNAVFGSATSTTGHGLVTQGNRLTLNGNLMIANEDSSFRVTGQSEVHILGNSIINQGVFEVSESSTLVLGTGTEFKGDGFYDMSLVAGDGVTLAPGNSIGTMAINNLTMAQGGEYDWEVASLDSEGVAGTDWDLVEVGELEISATVSDPFLINVIGLSLSGEDFFSDQSWLIATIDGAIDGFDTDKFQFDISQLDGTLASSQFSIELVELTAGRRGLTANFSAVPEPGTVTVGLAFVGCFVSLRRRRKAGRLSQIQG